MTDGYKIKRGLIRVNGVEKQFYPAAGWKPGSNTLLYCPLKDDILDHTGNHTMTAVTSSYGTVTKDSTGYYYFNGGYITSENWTGPKQLTISIWVKRVTKTGGATTLGWAISTHYKSTSPFHYFGWNTFGGTQYATTGNSSVGFAISCDIGSWEHIVLTYSSADGGKGYKNGVVVGTSSSTGDLQQYNGPTNIGATFAYTEQYYMGYISEVIYEDKVRTADEITAYYNQTKSNYGL